MQESDAELVHLPGTDVTVALTTDTIAEEIETGLYTDPHLIGWMTVMANASDLAAVGAKPVGLLLNETLPPDASEEFLARLQEGIYDACSTSGLHVLGGDTNFSSRLLMSACAIGVISDSALMSRRGCHPGDLLFCSGPLGLGNAYAFVRLMKSCDLEQSQIEYYPKARLSEGQLLRNIASCCMDTSDGVFATLDQLMRLNNVGFVLETRLSDILHPSARRLCETTHIPEWMMLAGPHGEFELLFAVPPGRINALFAAASTQDWKPLLIGKVVAEPGVWFRVGDQELRVDTSRIRNLSMHTNGKIDRYISELLLTVTPNISS